MISRSGHDGPRSTVARGQVLSCTLGSQAGSKPERFLYSAFAISEGVLCRYSLAFSLKRQVLPTQRSGRCSSVVELGTCHLRPRFNSWLRADFCVFLITIFPSSSPLSSLVLPPQALSDAGYYTTDSRKHSTTDSRKHSLVFPEFAGDCDSKQRARWSPKIGRGRRERCCSEGRESRQARQRKIDVGTRGLSRSL